MLAVIDRQAPVGREAAQRLLNVAPRETDDGFVNFDDIERAGPAGEMAGVVEGASGDDAGISGSGAEKVGEEGDEEIVPVQGASAVEEVSVEVEEGDVEFAGGVGADHVHALIG